MPPDSVVAVSAVLIVGSADVHERWRGDTRGRTPGLRLAQLWVSVNKLRPPCLKDYHKF